MKATTIVAAVAATFPVVQSLSLSQKRDASPRVLGVDIQKRATADPVKTSNSRFRKRATVTETLDNEGTFYFANLSLGTPAQSLHLTIDTGSSDLWVNAPNSTLCKTKKDECSASGTYDSSASSTYGFVNSDFNITYVDGSGATGDYVRDTLAFGGQTLKDFQFGIGYTSTSGQGVLGIGYGLNEVEVTSLTDTPYKNLPLAMVSAGLINTAAYSLWLNDLEASTGSILFGGVNKDKYTGELQTLPILQESGGYYAEFMITLTGVSYTASGSSAKSYSSDLPAAVLLDSGSSLTYLPDDLATEIYNAVGAEYSAQEEAAYVPCSLTGHLNFTFTSPSIQVDMDELLFAATDEQGNQLTFNDGTAACIFGISPAGDSTGVLGDTFLRSAYVVYDLANNEISLAQTDFNSTSNDILEISSGVSGVPGATSVTGAVTSVAAETGGARNGGVPTAAATVTGLSGSSTATATAASTAGAMPAFARPTGHAAMGYLAAGAALVAAAL